MKAILYNVTGESSIIDFNDLMLIRNKFCKFSETRDDFGIKRDHAVIIGVSRGGGGGVRGS